MSSLQQLSYKFTNKTGNQTSLLIFIWFILYHGGLVLKYKRYTNLKCYAILMMRIFVTTARRRLKKLKLNPLRKATGRAHHQRTAL